MTSSRNTSIFGYSLLFLSLARQSLQQNTTTNSTSTECNSFGFTDEPLNATGQVSFSGLTPPGVDSNSWILSEAFSDRRDNASQSTNQFTTFYLSTPVAQNFSDSHTGIQGCVYLLGAANKTSSGGSCDNIISSTCIDSITSSAKGVASGNAGQGLINNNICPQLFGLGTSCSKDNVGSAVTAGFNYSSSSTCDIDRDPVGISIPQGYRTDALFGSGSSPSDQIGKYDVYDTKIKQTTVFAIAAWGINSDYSDSRIVCIQPQNITAGSRTGVATRMNAFAGSSGSIGLLAFVMGALLLW